MKACFSHLLKVKRFLLFLYFGMIAVGLPAQCWELVLDVGESYSEEIGDVYAVNDSVMWLCGANNVLGYSKDKGDSWVLGLSPTNDDERISKVWFYNEEQGVIVWKYRKIYYTEDNGDNWTEAQLLNVDGTICEACTLRIFDIVFRDENEGWAIQERQNFVNSSNLLHTLDGGLSWTLKYIEPQYGLSKFVYANGDSLIIESTKNQEKYLHYSYDNGETWEVKPLNLLKPYRSFFLHTQLSWMGTGIIDSSVIYKSTDFWETHDTYEVPIVQNAFVSVPQIVKFVNENLGWGIVRTSPYELGSIFVSTDGGVNWHLQSMGINNPWDITIVNDSLVFVYTTHGELYRYRGRPAACGPLPTILQDSTLYPLFSWPEATDCYDGYYLQLGSTEGGDDLLAPTDVGLDTFYQVVEALPEATQVYATVLPYNHVYGAAASCESSNFTTITCPPSPIEIDTGYCKGAYLLWGDSLISEPGQYTFPGIRENGCDSTVVVNVIQYEDVVTPIDTAYCQGDVFYWQDSLLSGAGQYTFSYLAANGCDSSVIITLEELLLPYSQIDTLLCAGQLYEGQDTVLAEVGLYSFTYAAASGCDSLVQVAIDIAPAYTLQLDTFFCEGEGFYWAGEWLTSAGAYEYTYLTIKGCDSIWQISLEERMNVYTQIDTALTAGEPYNGIYYPNDTLLTFIYPAANGCDSIVQVQLDIISHTSSPSPPDEANSGVGTSPYRLYPNPTNTLLHIECEQALQEVHLWNALGQKIAVPYTPSDIDVSNLVSGLYFVSFRIGGEWYLERVVVE